MSVSEKCPWAVKLLNKPFSNGWNLSLNIIIRTKAFRLKKMNKLYAFLSWVRGVECRRDLPRLSYNSTRSPAGAFQEIKGFGEQGSLEVQEKFEVPTVFAMISAWMCLIIQKVKLCCIHVCQSDIPSNLAGYQGCSSTLKFSSIIFLNNYH